MAESDFQIQIDIDANLAPFRATLRTGLEEAAKGVTVPVRAGALGSPGGQGAAVSTAYSATDRAAVDAAFGRMQANTRAPGGYSPVMGPGGSFAPKVDTSGVAAGLREVFQRFEALKKHIETPIVLRVDDSAVRSAMARAGLAGGQGGRVPITSATTAAEWQSMTGTLPAGQSPGPMEDLAWQQRMNVQTGERTTVAGQPAGGQRAWGRLRGGNFLPTSSIRGLFGVLGISEVNRNLRASREAETESLIADSPVAAAQATQQSIQQQTSGLFGSAIGIGADLLLGENGPSGIRRRLQVAAANSQSFDRSRQSFAEVTVAQSIRSASPGLARSVAEIEGRRDLALSRLTTEGSNIRGTLQARPQGQDIETKVGGIRFGDAPPQQAQVSNAAYAEWQETQRAKKAELAANDAQKANERAQAARDIKETQQANAFAGTQFYARANQLNAQSAGVSDRIQARSELLESYRSRAFDARKQGNLPALYAERDAAERAQQFQFNRQDQNQLAGLQSTTDIANLQGANRPLDASIAQIRANAAAQGRAALQAGGPNVNNILASIAAAEQAQVRATTADANRSFQAQAIGLSGQGQQLSALLNRDPLEAQVAGIRSQRDASLAGLPNDARGRALAVGINANAGLQEQLARRSDTERRGDTAELLDSEKRQSALRTAGGDNNRVRAVLDRIVSETQRDVTGLERQGDAPNAQRRRELGAQQVRESRADYFRSFQFEEVGGDRIAASKSGTFGGSLSKDFKNAEELAATASGAASAPAQTFQNAVQQFVTAVQQLTSRGVVPRMP